MEKRWKTQLEDNQYRFKANRGAQDQILILRQIYGNDLLKKKGAQDSFLRIIQTICKNT